MNLKNEIFTLFWSLRPIYRSNVIMLVLMKSNCITFYKKGKSCLFFNVSFYWIGSVFQIALRVRGKSLPSVGKEMGNFAGGRIYFFV